MNSAYDYAALRELCNAVPSARLIDDMSDAPRVEVASGRNVVKLKRGGYDLWNGSSDYVKPNATFSEAVAFLKGGAV